MPGVEHLWLSDIFSIFSMPPINAWTGGVGSILATVVNVADPFAIAVTKFVLL